MLAEAQNYLREHHAAARLYVYGQDYNKRAFATAAADMLMKQVDHNGGGENVKYGDSFTDDQFAGQRYDYFLTNPPFGVDWKKQQKEIQREHDKSGFDGRFGAGLPRVNDGALLFLQHMIHKFEPVRPAEQKHGSRLAIVFSGSPLFTGGAGSGESEIRRWIIENDWLEAIIALPEQMFYNTGIGTYVWIVTNRKEKRRKGKIQLIDAREIWTVGASAENKRSLGDKRRHMTGKQIEEVIRIYGRFEESQVSKIFRNAEFGYTRVTVERPLRLRFQLTPERSVAFLAEYPDLGEDLAVIRKALGTTPHLGWDVVSAKVDVLLKKNRASWKAPAKKAFRATFCEASPEAAPVKGPSLSGFEPDPALRDFENVPLEASIDEYIDREVRPHVPDAWIDRGKNKIGYELSFTFHFHQCKPPRPLDAIYADLSSSEEAVLRLLRERTAIARSLTCGVEEGTSVRDSGIGWIGQIPAHWKTQKAAWLFRERDQRGEPELPLLEVSIAQGVVLRELSDSRVESTAADFNTYKVARAGDVVFNKMRMWQGAVGVAPQDGLVSPDYVVAAPTGLLSSDFAHLLFRTDMFSAECARRSHGIVWDRLRLYWEGFREIELPVPPAQEQAAIVAHLAEEAKKVEGLRATTERSIALLRELIAAGVAGQIELPHGEN
jgi:type I restriction enzyme M protein